MLQLIMQHAPLPVRLRAASVCSSWHKAAVAATCSIEVSHLDDAAWEGVHHWLQQYGSTQVTRLVLLKPRQHELKQLPCSQLRELAVVGGTVQLAAPGQDPLLQPTVAATLTKLELCEGCAVSGVQLSAVLAELRSLKHLHLDINSDDTYPQPGPERDLVCGSALQHLTALTYFVMLHVIDIKACNSYVSCLTNLQHLELEEEGRGNLSYAGWERLQQLTCLSLGHCGIKHTSLQVLTGLQELRLDHAGELIAADLLPLTQLRSISVQNSGYRFLEGLSAWLSQQQQLKRLCLRPVGRNLWRNHSGPNAERIQEASGRICAALAQLPTSQLQLQHLDFGPDLPSEVWQQLFAPGRQLTALTHLVVPEELYDRSAGSYIDHLDHSSVQAMLACCPALQCLDAHRLLQAGPELTMLQHLTQLHAVWPDDTAAAAKEALAALTSLRHLHLRIPMETPGHPRPTPEVVRSGLSCLTQLTSLDVKQQKVHNPWKDFTFSRSEAAAIASAIPDFHLLFQD